MIKKLHYLCIFLLIVVVIYFFYTLQNIKNKLSTTEDIGYSTFYYIFHPTIYPKFYSEYLFHRYEKSKLFELQEHSPIPYQTIIAAYRHQSQGILDENSMYKDRIDQLEDDLVCIGLSPERVAQYQVLFKYHAQTTDLMQKYKKLNYENLRQYCHQKATSTFKK